MKYDNSDMICVAAIAGAHGVKGDVKVKPFTDQAEDCLSFGSLMNQKGQIILTPKTWRAAGKFFAVKAHEITSREQAESLKSTKLYVPASLLPEPEEDEFYYRDLVGLDVQTDAGGTVGRIIAVHEFGAGDLLEIKPDGGKSYYHPFTKAAVPHVNIQAGHVVIVPQIADAARRQDEEG